MWRYALFVALLLASTLLASPSRNRTLTYGEQAKIHVRQNDSDLLLSLPSLNKVRAFWSDVLVVILFIQPHEFTTERKHLLETYRVWLPNLLFVAPPSDSYDERAGMFVCPSMSWLLWYDCIARVIGSIPSRNKATRGILVAHFDEVFLPQKLIQYDKTVAWVSRRCNPDENMCTTVGIMNSTLNSTKYGWADEWPKAREAALALPSSQYIGKYLVWHCNVFDIFYIPASIFPKFAALAKHFHKYGVISETAVPSILFGLQSPSNLDGASLDGKGCLSARAQCIASGDITVSNNVSFQHRFDLSLAENRDRWVATLLREHSPAVPIML